MDNYDFLKFISSSKSYFLSMTAKGCYSIFKGIRIDREPIASK